MRKRNRSTLVKKAARFSLTTDAHNFIVNEVKVYGSDSKYAGEEYNKPVAYYGTLELALNGMVRKCQMLDLATNPKDLLAVIDSHKAEIKEAVKAFGIYRAEQVKAELEKSRTKVTK